MDRRNRPGKRRARARPMQTVILFARTIRLGRGKRRLAKDIGDIGAWRFYRSAVQTSLRVISSNACWTVIIALDPSRDVSCPGLPFTSNRNSGRQVIPQGRGDLGQRMLRALNAAQAGPAVLIGTDIQGLTPAIIAKALRVAAASDFVFGQATDGGFWLVGAKRGLSLRQFDDVGWSEATTLAQAAMALPGAKRVGLTCELSDVDSAADLPG